MAHFAEVIDEVVQRVIVAEQEFIDNQPGEWVQTSYNTRGGKHYLPNSNSEGGGPPLRKNYAGVGYIYDSVRNAFYLPQPYPSWLLDDDTCQWDSPVPHPDDGKIYNWDESTTSWIEGVTTP